MLKTNLVLGFMLIIGLAFSTSLMAVDYYVDPSGTDNVSHGSGTGTDAWKTIEYAVENVADPTTATIVIHVSGDTYTLGSDVIDINRGFTNLTIQGAGATSTIVQAHTVQGSATDRVFYINGSDENVTLEAMTIRYGKAADGGGISCWQSNLTMMNCVISGNTSTGEGGGIKNNDGTLTMTNCTVSENNASTAAGGIKNVQGTLTMNNCTISGNTSTEDGGGINNSDGVLTLTNCTLSGNTANDGSYGGGGLFSYSSSVATITNCTFANNSAPIERGGGIYNFSSTLYIKNSIIANNTAGYINDFYNNGGTVTNNGYNAVETQNGTDFVNGLNGCITGSQCGDYLSNTLEENHTLNGTKTLKTTSGSVAINAGDPDDIANNGIAIPAIDQRGANRNGATDIGAYEYWDDGGSLSVMLSTFTAQFIENTPTLYWVTQSETDNMGWFVYRNDENDFTTSEKISEFIEGHGTTTQQQSYIYEDSIENPQVGDTYYYWLESIDYSGIVDHYDKVAVMQIPDIHNPEPHIAVPKKYGLQPGPNPFNSNLAVSYMLPKTDMVRIEIYNMYGQLIAQFNEGLKTADKKHTLEWDGKDIYGQDVSSGVLLIKLITSQGSETKKAILLR